MGAWLRPAGDPSETRPDGGYRVRVPAVLDGNDHHAILEDGVDEQHPAPGAEHEAETGCRRSTLERCSHLGEAFQRSKETGDAHAGVRRQPMSAYQGIELAGRAGRQLDAAAQLQVVQIDRPALASLLEPKCDPVPGAGDTVEDPDHLPGFRGRGVDRRREEGAGEGAIRHLRALGHQSELCGMFAVQGHVEATQAARSHRVLILHD